MPWQPRSPLVHARAREAGICQRLVKMRCGRGYEKRGGRSAVRQDDWPKPAERGTNQRARPSSTDCRPRRRAAKRGVASRGGRGWRRGPFPIGGYGAGGRASGKERGWCHPGGVRLRRVGRQVGTRAQLGAGARPRGSGGSSAAGSSRLSGAPAPGRGPGICPVGPSLSPMLALRSSHPAPCSFRGKAGARLCLSAGAGGSARGRARPAMTFGPQGSPRSGNVVARTQWQVTGPPFPAAGCPGPSSGRGSDRSLPIQLTREKG